jgi:hypothetical protein
MREDKTRSKNHQLNCALAGLRVCLIAIKALLFPDQSWPSLQERCQRDPSIAFRAIAKPSYRLNNVTLLRGVDGNRGTVGPADAKTDKGRSLVPHCSAEIAGAAGKSARFQFHSKGFGKVLRELAIDASFRI